MLLKQILQMIQIDSKRLQSIMILPSNTTLISLIIMLIKVSKKYYQILSFTLCRMTRFEDALQCYGYAIEINPEFQIIMLIKIEKFQHIFLIKLLLQEQMSRYEEALEYYDYAVQKDLEESRYFINKGIIQQQYSILQLNHYKNQINLKKHQINNIILFNKILKILNTSFIKVFIDTTVIIANTLQKINRFEDALYQCNQAVQLNPQDSDNYVAKANVLFDMNRFEEALEQYDNAIKKNSNDSYIL
ncbi:unnamed protein product [Paramecium octaurelia]|uniref:Tetratricopeptide repeat protein n=1 Tax=Paramecium octaurelia TaxID=43137 RepID=A0A8S1VVI2_PAROT|nr:unnamed protein product [Paramecium octaurelia]